MATGYGESILRLFAPIHLPPLKPPQRLLAEVAVQQIEQVGVDGGELIRGAEEQFTADGKAFAGVGGGVVVDGGGFVAGDVGLQIVPHGGEDAMPLC